MKVLFLLVGKVLSDALSLVPAFTTEDIAGGETSLVYIYYSRPNLRCPACESFNQSISALQSHIPVKKINFFEQPRLASRFYTFLFPSFVVRDGGRSYHLPVDTFERLEEIIKRREWGMFKPRRAWMDVDSRLMGVYSIANDAFFRVMQRSYVIFDPVPGWAINLGFSAIIVYVVYSICTVFTVPGEKKKKE